MQLKSWQEKQRKLNQREIQFSGNNRLRRATMNSPSATEKMNGNREWAREELEETRRSCRSILSREGYLHKYQVAITIKKKRNKDGEGRMPAVRVVYGGAFHKGRTGGRWPDDRDACKIKSRYLYVDASIKMSQYGVVCGAGWAWIFLIIFPFFSDTDGDLCVGFGLRLRAIFVNYGGKGNIVSRTFNFHRIKFLGILLTMEDAENNYPAISFIFLEIRFGFGYLLYISMIVTKKILKLNFKVEVKKKRVSRTQKN